MAKINSIRIANVLYDNDKKYIPDLYFEPNGKDMLSLLENGGGKSLTTQLIMQVVLPNEKMEQRALKDCLMNQKYTGHIAVEWILDSQTDEQSYLCTGFCFTLDNNKDLKYFNYLFDYNNENKFNIKSLPFTPKEQGMWDTKIITYKKFEEYLKNNKDYNIRIYDTIASYHRDLKEFRILPEEWKSMAITNLDEAGASKYFERAKKSRQLLENILIPEIIRARYYKSGNSNNTDVIFEQFSELKKKLLALPAKQKEITMMKKLRQYLENILAASKNLYEAEIDFENSRIHIERLKLTFENLINKNNTDIENLKNKISDSQQEFFELNWKKDSYYIFNKNQEYIEYASEYSRIMNEIESLKTELHSSEQQYDDLKNLKLFNELTELQNQIYEKEKSIKNINKSEPELTEMLNKEKPLLLYLWEQKKNEISSKIHFQENLQLNVENEIKNIET